MKKIGLFLCMSILKCVNIVKFKIYFHKMTWVFVWFEFSYILNNSMFYKFTRVGPVHSRRWSKSHFVVFCMFLRDFVEKIKKCHHCTSFITWLLTYSLNCHIDSFNIDKFPFYFNVITFHY